MQKVAGRPPGGQLGVPRKVDTSGSYAISCVAWNPDFVAWNPDFFHSCTWDLFDWCPGGCISVGPSGCSDELRKKCTTSFVVDRKISCDRGSEFGDRPASGRIAANHGCARRGAANPPDRDAGRTDPPRARDRNEGPRPPGGGTGASSDRPTGHIARGRLPSLRVVDVASWRARRRSALRSIVRGAK